MHPEHVSVERPALLSVADSARHLSLSVSMIYKLVREGRLQSVRIGTRHLITAASMDGLLAPSFYGEGNNASDK